MDDMRLDRFDFSSSYAKATLRGPIARSLVQSKGEQVRARAASMYGASGYGMRVRVGSTRVRAFVYTADLHAMRSNRLHNTLRKALG